MIYYIRSLHFSATGSEHSGATAVSVRGRLRARLLGYRSQIVNDRRVLSILAILVAAGATIRISLKWVQARFPVSSRPNVAPRPFTTFELLLSPLPLIVFLVGTFGFGYAFEYWIDYRYLTAPIILAYIGVVFLAMIAVPLLAARACGKDFYNEYLRLGEVRSGVSQRGANIFILTIGGAFLVASAVVYLLDHLL